MHPAIAQRLGCMLGLVPVALHDQFAADEDLAIVGDPDLDARKGRADRVDTDARRQIGADHRRRLGLPVARPSKILCIGLNYRKHAEEAGMPVPEVPILFMKASSSLCGPFDPIYIPRNSTQTDWEVELAVVIGKRAKYVTKENAYDYIAGYCVHNDVSERDFQLRQGGQWTKGKSADHFAPLGPYLVTKEEIPDPHQLSLWLEVNGELLQNSNTGDLIFDIPTLVSYVSNYMTLLPGDVISTGTPSGVGMGLKEPRYLKSGDRVRLGIEGLGESAQLAIQDPEA